MTHLEMCLTVVFPSPFNTSCGKAADTAHDVRMPAIHQLQIGFKATEMGSEQLLKAVLLQEDTDTVF